MMTLNFTIPNHLLDQFTPDGRKLILHYFKQIIEKLEEDGGNHQSLLDGMISFIIDFVEDEAVNSHLSYKQTLKLIEKLGTPTEVISSIRQKTETSNSIITKNDPLNVCQWCNFRNHNIETYCENCGRNLNDPIEKKSFRQFTIDHPYQSAFFGSYLTLFTFSILWDMITSNRNFTSAFWFNFFPLLLPSLIIGLVLGYLISQIYQEEISFIEKYNKIIEEYDGGIVFWTFFSLVFYGVIIGMTALVSDGNTYILGTMGTLIGIIFLFQIFLMIVRNADNEPKPDEISYHLLISQKSRVQTITHQRIKNFVRKITPILGVCLISIYIVIDIFLNLSILRGLASSIFACLFVFAVISTNYIIYIYSWPEIKEIMLNEK